MFHEKDITAEKNLTLFQKLHVQLTVFCTVITGGIFLALTGICLFFAEKNINQNHYNSFLTEMSSAISYLQEQDSISHQWLNQLHENGHIRLYLYDNQTPLFYQQYHTSEKEETLKEQILFTARETYGIDLFASANKKITTHTEFEYEASPKEQYYVSAGTIPKSSGHLNFIILYSLTGQQEQIRHLRMIILSADFFAMLLLAIFSWYFTKKMIIPLSEAQKKQTRFIASASHELRSPLAVLRSGLESLSKTDKRSEQEHFIQLMFSETSRMQNLINDMLLLASSDSKALPLHMADVQPDFLLLNVYEKFEPLAIKKQIRLSVSLPDDLLPDCRCDADRIEQVFSILMDNALSYTPAGGNITLSLQYTENSFFFRFADTGCGIPDNEKALIFDRFYRSDKAHTGKEHFGLGLCIAKEIVKKHAGTIWAEDSPGGGSCFVIRLPSGKL